MTVKKERVEYIDIAKGIGIILVVIGHSHCPNEVREFIYCFHMPFFFFISGLLISQERRFHEFLVDRIRYLLVPYYLLAFISIAFSYFASRHYGNNLDVTNAVLSVVRISLGLKADLEAIYNGVLWFLPCLFYVQLFGYLILRIKSDLRKMLIAIILSTSGVFLTARWPVELGQPLLGLSFWVFGYEIKRHLLQKILSNRVQTNTMLTLGLLIIVRLLQGMGGNMSMSNVAINNYVWFLIAGSAGSVAITISAMTIGNSRFLKFMGKNAIIIFGVHSLSQKAIDIPRILMGIDFYSMLGSSVYLFIIGWNVAVCGIIALLTSKTIVLNSVFARKY